MQKLSRLLARVKRVLAGVSCLLAKLKRLLARATRLSGGSKTFGTERKLRPEGRSSVGPVRLSWAPMEHFGKKGLGDEFGTCVLSQRLPQSANLSNILKKYPTLGPFSKSKSRFRVQIV